MESPLLHKKDLSMPLKKSRSYFDEDVLSSSVMAQSKLKKAICISFVFMILEIVGGVWAGSLAIVTDAAHVLSDVSGFSVSLFAIVMTKRIPTYKYTYGFHQAEILGALFSVMIVWAMTGILLWEAGKRFTEPQVVDGKLMSIMAVIGLVVNVILMLCLGHGHSHSHSHGSHDFEESHHDHHKHHHDHHEENLALKAAIVHVLGDMVQSAGVCVAALLIWLEPFDVGLAWNGVSAWNYADPICTLLFSILVMTTTATTVQASVNNLMSAAPRNVDVEQFEVKLRTLPNVTCVHDVHVWVMGSSNMICTAHVVVDSLASCTPVLEKCINVSKESGIFHTTFQIEVEGLFDHSTESFGGIHARQLNCCRSN